MATYITKKCPKCGFKKTVSSYGYMNDPLGIRISRCPACNELFKEKKTKEWIQMKPYQKYRAINPRGRFRVFCIGIFPAAFLAAAITNAIPALETQNGGVNVGVLLVSYLLTCAVLNYLFTMLEITGKIFQKRYCESIIRSRNPVYLEMLKQEGPVYEEAIPSWILVSKGTRKDMENYIAKHAADSADFQIPTFLDTIANDI